MEWQHMRFSLLEKKLIKLAYAKPKLRKTLLPLLRSKEAGKGKPTFKDFLHSIRDTKIKSPDTGNMVKPSTLMKSEKGRELLKNIYKSKKPKGLDEATTEPQENPVPKIYSDLEALYSKLSNPHAVSIFKIEPELRDYLKSSAGIDLNRLSHLSGASGLPSLEFCEVTEYNEKVFTMIESNITGDLVRRLEFNAQGKLEHIINAGVQIEKDFQSQGIGGKILYNQAIAAFHLGAKSLLCRAARGNEIIGYYVWPRLGYDGYIPPEIKEKLPKEFEDFTKVSQIFLAGGKEWWKENGDTFDAKFDIDNLQWLKDYLKSKTIKKGKVMKKKWLGIGDYESEEDFYDDILRHRIDYAKKERERLGLKPNEPLPENKDSLTEEELREKLDDFYDNAPPEIKRA